MIFCLFVLSYEKSIMTTSESLRKRSVLCLDGPYLQKFLEYLIFRIKSFEK